MATSPIFAGSRPPFGPLAIGGDALSHNQIYFSWYDVEKEDGYRVERSLGYNYDYSTPDQWVFVASMSANTLTIIDEGLTPATQYSYRVTVYSNRKGDLETSYPPIFIKTRADKGQPAAPLYLTGTVEPDQVELHWVDRSANESGFRIYRNDKAIQDVPADVSLFIDTTVKPNNSYVYKVGAFNDNGESISLPAGPLRTLNAINCPNLFAGGDGSEQHPFLIETPEQLKQVDFCLDSNFALNGNIDLATYTGDKAFLLAFNLAFSKTFDGRGFTISNLTYLNKDLDSIGLFRLLDKAVIKNLKLHNFNLHGHDRVGAVAGSSSFSRLESIQVTGIMEGLSNVGGVVGAEGGGRIVNCHADVTASGQTWIGGIVGYGGDAIIACTSKGNVAGTFEVGGIAGTGAFIDRCFSEATVTGGASILGLKGGAGGIVGDGLTVGNSYSKGIVSLNGLAGAVMGLGREVFNTYASGDSKAPLLALAGSGGAIGSFRPNLYHSFQANASLQQLRSELPQTILNSTTLAEKNNDLKYFYNKANNPMAMWDFTHIWEEHSDGPPTLKPFNGTIYSFIGVTSHYHNQEVKERVVNISGLVFHPEGLISLSVNGVAVPHVSPKLSASSSLPAVLNWFSAVVLGPGDNWITVHTTANDSNHTENEIRFKLIYKPENSGDREPPTQPTGLKYVVSSNSSYNGLKWTASTDNVGVAGYVVYMNEKPYGTIAATSANPELERGKIYNFQVIAFDAAGNFSAPSETFRYFVPPDDWPALEVYNTTPKHFPPDTKEAPVTIKTNRPARCFYGGGNNFDPKDSNRMDVAESLDHGFLVAGLSPGNSETYYVFCQEQTPDETLTTGGIAVPFSLAKPRSFLEIKTVGNGTIVRGDGRLSCRNQPCYWSTDDASFYYADTFHAIPDPGWIFEGWSGLCTGLNEDCGFSIDLNNNKTGFHSLIATFSQDQQQIPTGQRFLLNLDIAGSGVVVETTQTVWGCHTDHCFESFEAGTTVTLLPLARPGHSFEGWSGDQCAGLTLCSFVMDGEKNVRASFSESPSSSNLKILITGDGEVYGDKGVSCALGECDFSFPSQTLLNLEAISAPNFYFDRWEEGCVGGGGCHLTLDEDRVVRAIFYEKSLRPDGPASNSSSDFYFEPFQTIFDGAKGLFPKFSSNLIQGLTSALMIPTKKPK